MDTATIRKGHVTYHRDVIQGGEEWLAARCGLLTASEVKLILTPTLKVASNDKERAHLYELLAQRISGYVEPHYVGDDMLRGHEDEIEARNLYGKHVADIRDGGFVTNNRHGFTIGYSPDGLIGDGGLFEAKSRRQKYQVQTIVEHVATGAATIPAEYLLQCQTGLLVCEDRQWLDFASYCGGMPMCVIRVWPDEQIQEAIINAAGEFERRLSERWEEWRAAMASDAILIPTKRKLYEEMF
jgi:hypothetical protein